MPLRLTSKAVVVDDQPSLKVAVQTLMDCLPRLTKPAPCLGLDSPFKVGFEGRLIKVRHGRLVGFNGWNPSAFRDF